MFSDFYGLAYSIQSFVLSAGFIAVIIYCIVKWNQAPGAYACASAGSALLLINDFFSWGHSFLDDLGLLDTASETATRMYYLGSSVVYVAGLILLVVAIFHSRSAEK